MRHAARRSTCAVSDDARASTAHRPAQDAVRSSFPTGSAVVLRRCSPATRLGA
ncbi:hypothetical protein Cus16_0486 [Curtobacterium sp. ER1/6]|nr:hypothetical protein Cus16_0486 [Curtobacterium sp. ER1/6]